MFYLKFIISTVESYGFPLVLGLELFLEGWRLAAHIERIF